MSRRQLRRMVRWESVLICVFGGLLGVALGVGYGAALVRSLHSQGIDVLSIPGTKLVTYVVAAGVIGVFAAVWPARRAAKLDVLQAVATT
jgi:putative ABC transport system permease protein